MKRLLAPLLLVSYPLATWANDNPIVSMPVTTPSTPAVLQPGVSVAQDGDYFVMPPRVGVVAIEAIFTGTATVQPEVSFDTVNWYSVPGKALSTQSPMGQITTTGAYVFDTGGWFYFRTRISSYTSGTVTINGFWVEGSSPEAQSAGNSVAVSNFPATQPVSAASLPLPSGAATSANQTNGSQQTQVTNFPATQPVSAASLPLPTGAATAANQTNGSQVTSVSNFPATQAVSATALPLPSNAAQESGGNLATIASNQTSGAEKTQVTNFPATQAVSGSVAVTSLPVQPEYIADGVNPARRATVTSFNALKVDGSGRVQPVTGTVKEQKDTGRIYVAFSVTGGAGVAADTLMAMTVTRQGVQAAAAVTSYTIPTGRVLRCSNMTLCARTGAAAANWSRWELRNDPTGAGLVTAPIVAPLDAEPVAATTGLGASCANTWWPEGIEFSGDGKNMLVFSHNGAATTNVETGSIQCYEYTPLP